MRRVYLITGIIIASGLTGLGLWYRHVGAPTQTLADLLPGVDSTVQPTVTFAVIGDNEGDNPTYRNLVSQIVENPEVDFILHVGDLMANGGAEEISGAQELHDELGVNVPVYAVPGNHDIKLDASRTEFQRAFGQLPRSVDIHHVHLILLDNADRKVGFTDTTLSWLEADLAAWDARKPDDGIAILAYHRPFAYPLANILGDDETPTSRASNERFLSILSQHDIAHAYTGHVHTSIDYVMVTSRDATNRPAKTVPVTVSGGGGQEIQSAFGTLLQTQFHALVVEADATTLTARTLRPTP